MNDRDYDRIGGVAKRCLWLGLLVLAGVLYVQVFLWCIDQVVRWASG